MFRSFFKILCLSCCVSISAANYVQAYPEQKTSIEQQIFAQSIIYHNWSKVCGDTKPAIDASDAYKNWFELNAKEINLGQEQFANAALEQKQTLDDVVSNLIHVSEQEWGQLNAQQRLDKCNNLVIFLKQNP